MQANKKIIVVAEQEQQKEKIHSMRQNMQQTTIERRILIRSVWIRFLEKGVREKIDRNYSGVILVYFSFLGSPGFPENSPGDIF